MPEKGAVRHVPSIARQAIAKQSAERVRPQQLATIFQPFIQCSKVWEDRSDLP